MSSTYRWPYFFVADSHRWVLATCSRRWLAARGTISAPNNHARLVTSCDDAYKLPLLVTDIAEAPDTSWPGTFFLLTEAFGHEEAIKRLARGRRSVPNLSRWKITGKPGNRHIM